MYCSDCRQLKFDAFRKVPQRLVWVHGLVVVITGSLFWFTTCKGILDGFWVSYFLIGSSMTWTESGPLVMETANVYYDIFWHFTTIKMWEKNTHSHTHAQEIQSKILYFWNSVYCQSRVNWKSIVDNRRLGGKKKYILPNSIWACIQLLQHVHFHYKGKWLYFKCFHFCLTMAFECCAPVNGSVAAQAVIKSYLVQLCLSTLLYCWITELFTFLFIVQFIIFSLHTLNNIALSLNGSTMQMERE